MSVILEKLATWRSFRAVVFGDYMLDEFVYGDAERLSADAPVPVLRVRKRDHRPGGSANVCLNLQALGGQVVALGVVGDDAPGRVLSDSLAQAGVETGGLLVDPSRPTTTKQNLVGLAQHRHPQKMFRLDHESTAPVDQAMGKALLEAFDRELANADVVCLEDYAKGVCTPELCQEVIRRARAAGVEVIVDPARLSDFGRYLGATAMTPNRTEAEYASSTVDCDGEVGAIAAHLVESCDLDAIVVTLDRRGALLFERGCGDGGCVVPTVAREVYDVTGAGDVVLAGLAAARANGLSWHDAVRFANAAAGLEVQVFGVEPIPFDRVHHALLVLEGGLDGKTRTLDQLMVEITAHRKKGIAGGVGGGESGVVFSNGCFDVLHAGHVALLESASEFGDFLVVGLNDDASVARLKGSGRPINSQTDRARVLGALGSVDAVVLFGEDTPVKLIEVIKPDVLVKGADYAKEDVVGGAFVESHGGRIELVELVKGRSTTGTLSKMRRR